MKRLYYTKVRPIFIILALIITLLFLAGITGSTSVVPALEPITLILMGLGLLRMARYGRKIKRG